MNKILGAFGTSVGKEIPKGEAYKILGITEELTDPTEIFKIYKRAFMNNDPTRKGSYYVQCKI